MRILIAFLALTIVAEGTSCAPAARPAEPESQPMAEPTPEPATQPSPELSANPATAPAVELAERYFNLAEGYSIRPPARASRVQQRAASRSVVWSARDRTTGAIEWRLIALRQSTDVTEGQLEDRAKQMAEDMDKKDEFVVQSSRVITAGGRKAIDLRVVQTIERGQFWQRYVYVLTAPGELFLLHIFGPAADREELLAVHEAVLGSLELLDTEKLLKQRQANLAAGGELLASITAEKLAAVVEPRDTWFLVTQLHNEIGFMVVRERATKVYGRDGVEVKAWSLLHVAGEPSRQVAVVMLASADRVMESCTWAIGAGGAGSSALSMTKDGNKLQFAMPGQLGARERTTDTHQKVLDESVAPSYLPVAMSMMLPRLMDLAKPRSYGFAAYAGYGSELDVSTFTVVGPEEVEFGGREVRGFRATTRAAEDAEEDLLLFDQAGRLLRKDSPGHTVMERSTRQEVLERFPPAREMLNQIDAD